ncbi:Elongation of fatty acids protein 2 [Tyrophagus putrescentiae]|nr:Elongation of fatty acids protein 2 [Tyrophagus putrescentiae]
MGILGMTRLIADISPESIKEVDLKSLFGRRIAIDASMCIYQFLIAIRSEEYMMTNESGETTSHLVGLFYRSIKMLETGIKPVYVFDGKAPKLKSGELTKRAERRDDAKAKLEEAKDVQNIENIQRFNKRLVRVTRKMTEDCKKLLELLGLPVVQAPSEAEAQCAQLCKEGLVYAAATEDMDALTFGCPRLVRNLTSANNEKVKELLVEKILNGLGLTQEQFIDLSILMGCDYCSNIRGIGGKKGLDLIRKEKFGITEFVEVEIEYDVRGKKEEVKEEESAEGEVKEDQENGDQSKENSEVDSEIKQEENKEENGIKGESDVEKEEDEEYKAEDNEEEEEEEEEEESSSKKAKKPKKKAISVPENWPFKGARQLFKEPLVHRNQYTDADLKMKDIDEDGLVQFLCGENGFSEDRVRAAIKRAKLSKAKSSQTRIDAFFKVKPSTAPPASAANNNKTAAQKRNGTSGKGKGAPSKRGRR